MHQSHFRRILFWRYHAALSPLQAVQIVPHRSVFPNDHQTLREDQGPERLLEKNNTQVANYVRYFIARKRPLIRETPVVLVNPDLTARKGP